MEPAAVPDVEHVSRHQDAELHELRDRELRAAGIDTRVLPKVSGTGKTIKADPHARPCGPSPLLDDPMAMAALRAYVGQNDAIDGTWDPMTCTLTKPELPGAALPDPAPEPEDDPEQIALAAEREAARLKKAEKARKKRDKKKAAKKLSQGKANSSTELARKPVGSAEPGDKLNWQALGAPGVYGGSAPSPAVVRPEKPITTEDQLRSLGFGRKEREMLKTFQRLQRLTGLTDDLPELQSTHGDPYSSAGPSIAKQLEEYVERAGKVAEIVEAREICAKLSAIATDLLAEVEHAIKYPEESNGRDQTVLDPLRKRLRELQAELAHRAGEPELMKTEAAERMRQKLEKRLLPKLKVSLPQMAEKLRFLHMEVLKWRAPARSTQIVKAEEEAAAAAERQRAERQRQMALLQEEQLAREQELAEIAPEDNPLPDEEEMRVLESMGWGGPAT